MADEILVLHEGRRLEESDPFVRSFLEGEWLDLQSTKKA